MRKKHYNRTYRNRKGQYVHKTAPRSHRLFLFFLFWLLALYIIYANMFAQTSRFLSATLLYIQHHPITETVYASLPLEVVTLHGVETPELMHSIEQYAQSKNVSLSTVRKIAYCETQMINTQSHIIQKDGTREDSHGIAQIHKPSHPTISLSDSYNPEYAYKFIIDGIADGNISAWHAYNAKKDTCTNAVDITNL